MRGEENKRRDKVGEWRKRRKEEQKPERKESKG